MIKLFKLIFILSFFLLLTLIYSEALAQSKEYYLPGGAPVEDYYGPAFGPSGETTVGDVQEYYGPAYGPSGEATASPNTSDSSSATSGIGEAASNAVDSGSTSSSGGEFFSSSFKEYLPNLYIWALGIGGALAVAVLVWAGFDYATSAGDVEKINQAKEKIVGAVLGLLVLLLAALILRALGASA